MYLVMAYRYGNSQGYNFPVGIYDTLEIAENEANLHRNFRGGKYDHKIYLIELNRSYDAEECKVISKTGDFSLTKGN